MSETLTGRCLCGAVSYRIERSIAFRHYACHCTECQTRSGSAFTMQQVVFTADLALSGETSAGHYTQPSGARSTITTCATCRVVIHAANDRRPGMLTLRAGTLDNSATIEPGFHLWTASMQPWIVLPEGVPALSGQPADLSEWQVLLAPVPV